MLRIQRFCHLNDAYYLHSKVTIDDIFTIPHTRCLAVSAVSLAPAQTTLMLPIVVFVKKVQTLTSTAPNLSWSIQKCGVFKLAMVMVAREARLSGKM
jgi:hypothetical protein